MAPLLGALAVVVDGRRTTVGSHDSRADDEDSRDPGLWSMTCAVPDCRHPLSMTDSMTNPRPSCPASRVIGP